MDRFIRHDHATFEQQLLDVVQAQVEPEIPEHCATDDDGGETMTVIEQFCIVHCAVLRDRPSNVTTPVDRLAHRYHAFRRINCGARQVEQCMAGQRVGA